MKPLEFAKGSGSGSSSTADTIIGTDNLEVLLGISVGPIHGLENGPRSFLADDTFLVDASGQQNFKSIALTTYPGSALGQKIVPTLGGFASPTTVGQVLSTATPLTRTGTQTMVDAIDFRIVVNALYNTSKTSQTKGTVSLVFEYKTVSGTTWLPCWAGGAYGDSFASPTPATGAVQSFAMGDNTKPIFSFSGDYPISATLASPSSPPSDISTTATAIDSSGNVYLWNTTTHIWTMVTLVNPPVGESGYLIFSTLDGSTQRRVYTSGFLNNSAPRNARPGDVWRASSSIALVWNGATWAAGASPLIATFPAHATPNGGWSLNEKITSPVSRNIRFFLTPGTDAIMLRVTKTTGNDVTTGDNQSYADVTWDSFNEIKRTPMTFYNVALAHIVGQASEQFTQIPQWNGIYEGRIIKVPTNYDPIARTYAGIWDGTYKLAYTNNPAFVFQDFVENTDYGLSSIYPHVVNASKIYEWAQNCDVLVHRADGTMRPRYTYNDLIDHPREIRELARFIAGSGAAIYVDDGNGIVEIMIDKAYSAVALFTRQNVGETGFEYSYTDRQSRANEYTVSFINPTLLWGEDKRIVNNPTDIATYNRIPASFIAAGCTDVDEAVAKARGKLISGLTEKEFVTFSTNRKGRYLSAWDTILVADADMGTGMSGRITSVLGASSVLIRDAITFQAGFSYVATFDVVNTAYPATSNAPYTTVRMPITNGAGTATTLTFTGTLPTLAEYANFTIEAAGLLGFPKPYRVLKIAKDSGDPDRIVVTALNINVNKYAYIDTAIDNGIVNYSNLNNAIVLPPTAPKAIITTQTQGAIAVRVLTLSWTQSTSPWVLNYSITHSISGQVVNTLSTKGVSVDFQNVSSGVHEFTIQANDWNARASSTITFAFDVIGDTRIIPDPLNLRILDAPSTNIADNISPNFTWDAPVPADPNFDHYQIQVTDPITGTVRRTEQIGRNLKWTYDWVKQQADGGARTFQINLVAVDQFGGTSSGSGLSITNPPPAMPGTLILHPAVGGFTVAAPASTDRDTSGLLIWASSTSGFDPTSVAPSFDGGPGNSFFVTAALSSTVYVRAAFYDPYGKTPSTLYITAQQSVSVAAITPASITGLGGLATKNAVDLTTTDVTNKSLANLDGTANTKLLGIQTGATYGADWLANLANLPGNLAALSPSDAIKNSVLAATLAASSGHTQIGGLGTLAVKEVVDLGLADGTSGGVQGKRTTNLLDDAGLGTTATWGGVSSRPPVSTTAATEDEGLRDTFAWIRSGISQP